MPDFDPTDLCGWRYDPEAVSRVVQSLPLPMFAEGAPGLVGSGAGQTTLLYKAFKEVNGGSYIDYPAQTIGDCVSQGHGHGVDLLECVQIALGKKSEIFHQTCTEAIYGMMRELGNDLKPTPPPEKRVPSHSYPDGGVGAWAAKSISTQGTISRDSIGPYDGGRAALWGGPPGVPANIKAQCSPHKVQTISLVTTTDELDDALANGYPVTVCSSQGFTMNRDQNGFCSPRGDWGHCMLIVGVRKDEHPGYCIFQSWGSDNPAGPLALDQPPNSFWITSTVMARMLARQDSWALSNFEGYPGQTLPTHWNYSGFA